MVTDLLKPIRPKDIELLRSRGLCSSMILFWLVVVFLIRDLTCLGGILVLGEGSFRSSIVFRVCFVVTERREDWSTELLPFSPKKYFFLTKFSLSSSLEQSDCLSLSLSTLLSSDRFDFSLLEELFIEG